jgi:hypothetical protein
MERTTGRKKLRTSVLQRLTEISDMVQPYLDSRSKKAMSDAVGERKSCAKPLASIYGDLASYLDMASTEALRRTSSSIKRN